MTFYYLDTSAWVKRYLTEAGSGWVRKLFERKEACACSPLGYIEALAAISRQQGVRHIPFHRQEILRADLLSDWNEMLQVPIGPEVLERAARFAWEHRLRGADAIHLAAAHWLHESLAAPSVSLTLITADTELIRAAQELNLAVTNPAELT